ncbi:DUF3592 domain-containing protein [Nakamurella endophytica]|uniref:DUF3592 domain-containing protein n=1 Tax=Nakamurella endophytica TaxID=1748367 RepID=A0A917SUG3_9ACTN|nr:DUF3592 domain-containing protein [Nakamurella endophytica]GGL98262.1 hypothetical protein GCM10011594_17750 [Nakamurella endophytica]
MPGPTLPHSGWIGLAVLAVALVCVVTGVTTLLRARGRSRTWVRGTGRVVQSRLDGDGHIRFRVAFEHAGQEVTFWNRFTSGTGVDPVGRDVDILVNPVDPSDAVVVGGPARPGAAGWAFVAFGVVAAIVGLTLTRALA